MAATHPPKQCAGSGGHTACVQVAVISCGAYLMRVLPMQMEPVCNTANDHRFVTQWACVAAAAQPRRPWAAETAETHPEQQP